MQAQFSHEDRITNSDIHHTMLESSESSARKEPSSFRLQRACICILLKSRESSCRTTASVAWQPANEASNAPWGYSRLRTRTRQPGPEIDKKNGLTFWVSKRYLSMVSQLVSVCCRPLNMKMARFCGPKNDPKFWVTKLSKKHKFWIEKRAPADSFPARA